MENKGLEYKSIRKSSLPKTTGEAKYVSDIMIPGCLYGYVVRSPYAHAMVKNIDVTEAKMIPGVYAVVTSKDIPGKNRLGKTRFDQPILADEKVRSYQDAVALIAAVDRETALEAASKLRMEFDVLPTVFSLDEALQVGAPDVHADRPDNRLREIHLEKGSIEQGFTQSDLIIEETYETPSIEHCYFEPDNGIILPKEDGQYILWIGCHSTYTEQQIVSDVLNIPKQQVMVIQPYTGGSFGGKDDGLLTGYLALLAYYSKKPVRISFSRQELFISHTKRHPQKISLKMGFTKDGHILAARYRIQTDTGAYAHWAEGIFTFASIGAPGPYRIPNIMVDTLIVYTNNIPNGAMRAWGMPGVNFATESHLDQAAKRLSLHPLDLRWRNAARDGDLLVTGAPFPQGVHMKEVIALAANRLDIQLTEQI